MFVTHLKWAGMFTVKLDKIPENISFSLIQNLTQPYITTRQGEYRDSEHTEKQIVYSKRTDGKLCKNRKWLIPYQYLPLLKDAILRRPTEQKRKLWKCIISKRRQCFITYRTLLKGRLVLKYFRRTPRSLILWWDKGIRSDEGIAPEGYPWELWGCATLFSESWPYFRPKYVILLHKQKYVIIT